MKFLVIDTETSGLFDFKTPADGPGQPRMASFAAIHLDAIDAEPRRTKMFIRPTDAMADADAALGVLRWLHANDALPAPAVHYAKEASGSAANLSEAEAR